MQTSPDKSALRRTAARARAEISDKQSVSEQIIDRLIASPPYQQAQTVLWYLDVRHEVRTTWYVQQQLTGALPPALGRRTRKRLAIPYCVDDDLQVFRLDSMDQLQPGAYGILEPKPELRNDPKTQLPVDQFDLIITPGVAFDPQGGRIGHGKGYYDRLLARKGQQTLAIALAFHCQVLDQVPMSAHDVPMDYLVTEDSWMMC
ncbi:MAG: 5-formyltetrahydrofolate cyclo-ligase [Rhodopirellula sp. TMED11]|nr:MAG: 5-formyltetrahydrofolate cyclo-ligase [Rhodopirellula sp. TMED11]